MSATAFQRMRREAAAKEKAAVSVKEENKKETTAKSGKNKK